MNINKEELRKKYNFYINQQKAKIEICNRVITLLPSLDGKKVTKRLEKNFSSVLDDLLVDKKILLSYYKDSKEIRIYIKEGQYPESLYGQISYNDYVDIYMGDIVNSKEIATRLNNWIKSYKKSMSSVQYTLDNIDKCIEEYLSIQSHIQSFKEKYDCIICDDLRLKFY